MNAVVSRVQSMLMDIRLDDRVGLDVHGITPTVRFDTEREVGVRINIPMQPTKKPESPVLVPECRVAYCGFDMVNSNPYDTSINIEETYQFFPPSNC